MSKNFSEEQYKKLYAKILPADSLYQSILSCKKKQGNRKKYYIAAGISLAVFVSSFTVYAMTHASLVKEFFGNLDNQKLAQEYYTDINQQITCDGNIYTIEGNIYSEELGKGYLAIKVTGKENEAPDVSWDDAIMPTARTALGVLGLKVEKSYVGIIFSKEVGSTAKISKEEDGTYIYIAYYDDTRQKEPLKISIQMQKNIEDKYQKLFAENDNLESNAKAAFYLECEWTELSYQQMQTIQKDCGNGVTILMNNFDVCVEWNDNREKIDNITLIDLSGNRHELLKDGKTVTIEGQWEGNVIEQGENGDCTLYARLEDMISLEDIQVEINGQLIK